MDDFNRRQFIGTVAGSLALPSSAEEPATDLVLWYGQPAEKWTDALPIGNGRLGAMVFGGIDDDRLQLNEDTLWSGGPRQWDNPDAKKHLAEVRRLVLDEKNYVEADRVCRKMQGSYNESYLPLGDLRLGFENPGPVSEYRRELNLDTAVSRVTYRSGDAVFTREAFSSAPDQAMVVRLKSSRPASLTFTISLDSPLTHAREAVGGGMLRLYGKAPSHVEPNYVKSDDPVIYDEG